MNLSPRRNPSSAPVLTEAEVSAFDEQGFVGIARPVVTGTDLATAETRLTALLQSSLEHDTYRELANGTREAPQIHEIVDATKQDRRLLRTNAYRTLEQVARELLGCERVRHHFDHVILKPPHNEADTGWHQDIAFDPETDDPMATIWLSFVDVDASSGCMRYLPATHRLGRLEHRRSGRDGLSAVDIDDSTSVSCPLPAGGVSIHGARTLHGSSTNDSDEPRLAWIVKFVPENRPVARAAASRQWRRAKYAWQHRSQK